MNPGGARKYAIYGGTFDPIHIGHVALARHAAQECSIDKLIFMPDHISPFKQTSYVTSGKERCDMIERILGYHPAFCLSHYEVNREGPSYTVETLRHFRKLLGGSLSFVLGFDSIVQLDKWYKGEEILREYPLITARRPDTDDSEGLLRIEYFRREFSSDITVLEMEPVNASATMIRSRIREGMPISDMVPPEVEEYIIKHDLYK